MASFKSVESSSSSAWSVSLAMREGGDVSVAGDSRRRFRDTKASILSSSTY